MLKIWLLILIPCFQLPAQTGTCFLKDPGIVINFGTGSYPETNTGLSTAYRRVASTCPTDGHYAIVPYTSDCFRGDWITLEQDHTVGDRAGNMLLINSSYSSGEFFNTRVNGLKPGAHYEFSIWMLNLCKPSEKCPFPLLPDITIRLTAAEGKQVMELNTGDLKRYQQPKWARFSAMFRIPKGSSSLILSMTNHSPGGCGNDLAIDDISFRECVLTPPPVTKKTTPSPLKKIPPPKGPYTSSAPPKNKPAPGTANKNTTTTTTTTTVKQKKASPPTQNPLAGKPGANREVTVNPKTVLPPPPPALANRANPVIRKFESPPGVIKVSLFDNGQIDGDTVSIYHNNKLILSKVRLSEKAVSFTVTIDVSQPHHELVMVANNLGSIPPNTSLMYVTVGTKKHEVFISSTETQNAKLVFDLEKQ